MPKQKNMANKSHEKNEKHVWRIQVNHDGQTFLSPKATNALSLTMKKKIENIWKCKKETHARSRKRKLAARELMNAYALFALFDCLSKLLDFLSTRFAISPEDLAVSPEDFISLQAFRLSHKEF